MKKVLTLSLSLALGLILLLTVLTNISEGISGLNTSFVNAYHLWNTNTLGSIYPPYFSIPSWSNETFRLNISLGNVYDFWNTNTLESIYPSSFSIPSWSNEILRLNTSFGNTYNLWNTNNMGYFNAFQYGSLWNNTFNSAFGGSLETRYNPWTGHIQFGGEYIPPNHPPALDPIGHKTVNEGALLEFSINAEDPDGGALTYSVSNLPIGASFNPASRTFTWKPDFTQAGDHQDIRFTVSDNGTPSKKDLEAITITVIDVGYGPWPMKGHDTHHTGQSPYETGLYPFTKWAFDVGSERKPAITSSPAIGADGTVYIGDNKGYLNALNPDGSLKWAFKTQGHKVGSTPAIGPDGTVYVGSDGWWDNSFYALNPDGSLKWEFEAGPSVSSSPVIGEDGTIYVGTGNYLLYALNPDGSLKWAFETGGWVLSSPAIGADGTIYVGSSDKYLYALNPDSSLKWAFETGNYVKSSPAIGADGTIYILSDDGYLYALNPDGSLEWKYNIPVSVTSIIVNSSPTVGADGTIYVRSSDGNLYALNPDGSLKWTFLIGGGDRSSPAIGAGGTIYIGDGDSGYLYALNPDGSLKWAFETDEVFVSPQEYVPLSPAIGADGTVYMGGDKLYAIGTMSNGVQGKVTDLSNGSFIEGAIISIIENTTIKSTHLIQMGDYALGLPPGMYEITVSKDGYRSLTKTDVAVDANTVTELDFELPVVGPLQITTEILKTGIFNQMTNTRIRISGGIDPYKFSTVSGTLPPGLTLDISTGKIQGIPTAEGSFTFTIGVSDSANDYQEKEFNLNIIPNESPWPMEGHDRFHTGESPYETGTYPLLRWTCETGGDVYSPVIGADGTVYVGSADKHLYALNPDGSLKWTYKTWGSVTNPPAIGEDGTIYIGYVGNWWDPYLYALNPDGSLKWQSYVGGYIFSSPTIGADETVYVGSGNDIYALNPDSSIKWIFKTGDMVYSTPAISSDGTLYVGSFDMYLYALNPDGSLKWNFKTGGLVMSSPAISSDGTVYVGSTDRFLYALNPDGSLKWTFETGNNIYFSPPAIGSDGTVYVGSADRFLYALNPDGSLKWSYEIGSPVYPSAAISADGTIYVGSIEGYLHALNPDGSLKWSYEIGDNVHYIAIGADGTIYMGSDDNKLYALGTVMTGIIGKVTDLSNDLPIEGVVISTNEGNGRSTQSNQMGEFLLELNPGVYEITVSKDGYRSITMSDVIIDENMIIPINFVITDPGSLRIITDSLWPGIYNQLLKTHIRIAGGIYPYNFSIVSGGLPPGITLDMSTGFIQGTPTAEGLYTFTIGVSDSASDYQEREFSLNIVPNESPWPMRGHDIYHTGQSPHETGSYPYLRWACETGDDVDSSPAIGADGTMYIGSDDGYLYAFRHDGSFRWAYKTDDHIRSSPAIGADGSVYVGSDDGYLYALNPYGNLKWRYETGDDVRSSPVIGADGMVYFGSDDNALYALNPDGSLGWAYETGGSIVSSPTIGVDGTVYVGSDDGYLYAIDPNGNLKWEYETDDWVESSPAIGSDGTVYVGSDDCYFYALNPDGSLKWRYETGDYMSSSPAIGIDGSVYVGSDDGYFYALNPDGSLKWAYETGGSVISSPAIGADGTVYVGSDDGCFYALNPDGSLKWHFETGYNIRSSPAIGAYGTIYVGSDDNRIYAIETFLY